LFSFAGAGMYGSPFQGASLPKCLRPLALAVAAFDQFTVVWWTVYLILVWMPMSFLPLYLFSRPRDVRCRGCQATCVCAGARWPPGAAVALLPWPARVDLAREDWITPNLCG